MSSTEQRFWFKVNKTDTCWLWTASKNAYGYGNFMYNQTCVKAHRLAYELENGIIPKGMNVLHKCDNTSCVRPDHLFLGTQSDNVNDMVNKGRHWRKRITDEQVKEIILLRNNNFQLKEIAAVYSTSCSVVSRIVNGKYFERK